MADESDPGLVDAHAKRIIDALATDTGVAREDVAKVLKRLGLETALANRVNVKVDDVRLAASPLKL